MALPNYLKSLNILLDRNIEWKHTTKLDYNVYIKTVDVICIKYRTLLEKKINIIHNQYLDVITHAMKSYKREQYESIIDYLFHNNRIVYNYTIEIMSILGTLLLYSKIDYLKDIKYKSIEYP